MTKKKKANTRFSAVILAVIMLITMLGTFPVQAASLTITKSGGWFETAYAEWSGGSNCTVYYKLASAGDSAYIQADQELVRGNRVDIPGLRGGTAYDIKIVSGSEAVVTTITPMSYDRSGYAHWNHTEGVGAYNDDGTPKNGASIIYVTNETKDTVTFNGQTGLYNILYKNSTDNLIVRFIGQVDVPSGAKANDGSSNDGSHMLYLNELSNITMEGIGYDAHLVRWGFEIKRGTNIEVRNLYFYQYPDDAVGVSGNSSMKSQHIWIHNNDFGIGLNEYAGNGTVDADKAEGDGSTDVKWSEYVTISYNYYNHCHKTSLVGGGTSHQQDWITYHHNWFDSTMSRNPRARIAHIHTYNNYFSNISSYAIAASYNSRIFSEANYFYKCNNALDTEAMGSDKYSGTIKSYNDILDDCSGTSIYTAVTSRMQSATINNLVSGGENYDNFDIDSSKIYLNSYTPQTAAAAKEEAIAYSGRMDQADYNPGSEGTVTDPTVPGDPTDPEDPDEPGDVVITDTMILDADEVAAGTYSSDVVVNPAFTIKVNAADAVTVDASAKTSSDGVVNMSQRIKLGGAGNTANRSIQITASGAGTLTVYMMCSNSTDTRVANLLNAGGSVIASAEPVAGTSLEKFTFNIPEAGVYYLASASSGINVYYAILATETQDTTTTTTETTTTTTETTTTETTTTTSETTTTTTTTTEPVVTYAAGDLNNDSCLNVFDVLILKRGLLYGFTDSAAQTAADYNSDGSVTIADVIAINKFILQK